MLGGKESLDKTKFTPDDFTKAYTGFIQEMKALKSNPEIVLISPIYSAKSVLE
jgi:hypothetical protein